MNRHMPWTAKPLEFQRPSIKFAMSMPPPPPPPPQPKAKKEEALAEPVALYFEHLSSRVNATMLEEERSRRVEVFRLLCELRFSGFLAFLGLG